MDLESTQTNAAAILPLLKHGDYKMWRLKIEQYIQPRLCSMLSILGENISQEDLNLKFLRSLLAEWKTSLKQDLETISFDDLYNNFKIVEQEVKRSVTSSSNLGSQNVAFVSSTSSSNDVNTANVQFSTANSPVSTASILDNTASLSDATRTRKKITINGSDTAGYDKTTVECFNCHKMGHFARECRGPRNQESRTRSQDNSNRNQDSSRRIVNVEDTFSNAMVALDGAGFDWSFMVEEEVPTNMALMAFSDSELNKSEFDLATYKRGLASVEEQLVFYKKNEVMLCLGYHVIPPPPTGLFPPPTIDLSNSGLEEFKQPEFAGYGPKATKSVYVDTSNEIKQTPKTPLVKELVSEKAKQTVFLTKIEFVKQQDKTTRKSVKYAEMLSVNTIKGNEWPKAVNTARPHLAVVNTVRVNQENAVKASACWVWRPTKLDSA
ncbi:putative ribonuclease H-like domain-containing protein [Tanacetum coccineum]